MRLENLPDMKCSLAVTVLSLHIRCEVERGGGGNTRSKPGTPKRRLPIPASLSSLSSWCAKVFALCSHSAHQALRTFLVLVFLLLLLLCLRYGIVCPLHLLPQPDWIRKTYATCGDRLWETDRRWRCVGGISLWLRGGEGCFLVPSPLFEKTGSGGIVGRGEWGGEVS